MKSLLYTQRSLFAYRNVLNILYSSYDIRFFQEFQFLHGNKDYFDDGCDLSQAIKQNHPVGIFLLYEGEI